MRNALLALIGAFTAAAFLIGITLDLDMLRLATKPWPVLAMAAWIWPQGDRRVALGLITGAIGDLCLALPGAFLPGMLAFAVGHGLYVWAFFSWHPRLDAVLLLPVVAYLGLALSLMLPGTGPLTIPVIIYMSIIAAMLWRAAAIAADETRTGFMRWGALLGALLFGFSDSLIGLNKFATLLPGAAFPIILLYWGGQGLIAAAAVICTRRATSADF